MSPACITDNNIGLWHDSSPAYLYSYDNWHLQQEVTLVTRIVTNRTSLKVKILYRTSLWYSKYKWSTLCNMPWIHTGGVQV